MTSYTVGLDLGQGMDFSALAVVERVLVLPAHVSVGEFWRRPNAHELIEEWHVRALRRWELGTPYPSIVADVVRTMRAPVMDDAMLLIDGTGVGRAVRDMFWDEWDQSRFGVYPPRAVTITAGHKRNGWNFPKTDLFAAVQVPLQQGRLRIADGLALGETLADELLQFRQRITDSGRDVIDFERRPGQGHGDLVNALALAMVVPNTARRPDVIENSTHMEVQHG
ncbi:hypothetical protein [Demequina iriomotensis]|uniref:hypothetical protein n=1 Tax=Demequina iriomotensis TaxID=1536641 RepID=UPI0007855EBC|nr:hypothetical protein [Demequina iriomotensis]